MYTYKANLISHRNRTITAVPSSNIKSISPHPWLGLPLKMDERNLTFSFRGKLQPDLLYAGGLLDLYSGKLLSIIKNHTDALEYYPAKLICDTDSAIEYFIVNFLGLYSIKGNSDFINLPHVSKYNALKDPKIFRPAELMPFICISDDIRQEFLDEKITGIRIDKLIGL